MVKFSLDSDNWFYESLCERIYESLSNKEHLYILVCSIIDVIKFFKPIISRDCYIYCLENSTNIIMEQFRKLSCEIEKENN